MPEVTTKRSNVVTYKRPSVKAIQATCSHKPGQVLHVHPTIKGWFEIRRVNKDGVRYAEFIRKEDVVYTMKYLMGVVFKRMKALVPQSVKNVLRAKNK